MKDAFGVSKVKRKVILRQLRDSAISTTYDRSKKKRSKVSKRIVYHGTTARAARKIMREGFKVNDLDAEQQFIRRPPSVYFSNLRAAREFAKPSRNALGFVRSPRVVRAESPDNGLPAFDHGPERENPRFHQPWRRTENAESLKPKGVIRIPLTRGQVAQNVGIGTAYSASAAGAGSGAFLVHRHNKKKRVAKSFPKYGMIKNMPGKRRILRIDGDTVHFEEEGVASRAVHRSRVTFLKDKPLAQPKWTQGTLFKGMKLPRIKRMTLNQPHNNDAEDTIIHNGRRLLDHDERMQAVTQMNAANRIPKFFSPYRVKEVPASGGAKPMQPTGTGSRRSDTVLVERKHLYEIPAVQVGAGTAVAGAGSGAFLAHRKKKRVAKFFSKDAKFALTHKKMALKYIGKRPAHKAMDKYYSAKNKVLPKKNMDNWGDVSKIAMQPVYHGTTKAAAKVLMRGKWNPTGSKYVPGEPHKVVFTASQEKHHIANMFGVMRTGRSKKAGPGVIRDKLLKPDNARVLTYNAVGVRPVRTDDMERVYDAKELGRPLASHKIPSRDQIEAHSRATTEATGLPSIPSEVRRNGSSREAATAGAMDMPHQMPKYALKGLSRRNTKAYNKWKRARNQNVHKSAFLGY